MKIKIDTKKKQAKIKAKNGDTVEDMLNAISTLTMTLGAHIKTLNVSVKDMRIVQQNLYILVNSMYGEELVDEDEVFQ